MTLYTVALYLPWYFLWACIAETITCLFGGTSLSIDK
jgi:hypothetical protein